MMVHHFNEENLFIKFSFLPDLKIFLKLCTCTSFVLFISQVEKK